MNQFIKTCLFIWLILPTISSWGSAIVGNSQPKYPISEIDTALLKNAKAVIRHEETYYTVKSPSEANTKMRFVITMLKEGDLMPCYTIHYDAHSKIKNIKARFYDAEGNLIRQVPNDEIRDQIFVSSGTLYSDNRIKCIENKYGVYPYTFEVEYEKNYTAIMGYPPHYFQNFEIACQNTQYTLSIPNNMTFHHRVVNMDLKPTINKGDNNTTYQWAAKNIAALATEPYMPNPTELLAHLEIAPDQFQIDGYVGEMNNWQNYGKFIYTINKDRDQLPPETIAELKQLVEQANDEQKIAILYNYLQKNMRYVSIQIGIGGWQTFDANVVDKNKYGDCKALSNYMKAMLKVVGINANTILVSAGEDDFFQPDEQFCWARYNHVILYIPEQKKWLECTSNQNPVGYLGAFTQGRKGLLITEQGGQLIDIPALNESHNSQISHTTVNLLENGSASIEQKDHYKGSLQDDLRASLNTTKKEVFWEQYRNNINISHFIINEQESEISAQEPELNIIYKANSNKYAVKTGSRLLVPINPINPIDIGLENADNRQQPIKISPYNFSLQSNIEINLPEGYQIETLPEALNLNTPYGTYQATIAQKDRKIVFQRQLIVKSDTFAPNQYNDIHNFYQKIQQVENNKMVLVKK